MWSNLIPERCLVVLYYRTKEDEHYARRNYKKACQEARRKMNNDPDMKEWEVKKVDVERSRT